MQKKEKQSGGILHKIKRERDLKAGYKRYAKLNLSLAAEALSAENDSLCTQETHLESDTLCRGAEKSTMPT